MLDDETPCSFNLVVHVELNHCCCCCCCGGGGGGGGGVEKMCLRHVGLVDGSVVLCRTKVDSGCCGFLLLWLKNAPLHIEHHGAVQYILYNV
ncbi:uncharacterized protein BO66DRAFT_396560 [Aspergillus aculeatinus CBS 121060]|uniref:Uncharacterized protein n=1 Tax=Aspergillus aculeatinus CBS 121060 TaxID=1448322 RepID=A0ACD1GRF1_9EURO|nr:hypothetical protein BO66DRAFT_396560 [Aspergillus aculeatinus CBS 121060]RAH63939.1 hypothetical protein BO66DRAFT_396560 [Aspergillus aculeatinus CBS 121060]